MAGQLTDRVKETGLERVKEVARRIAHQSPSLADLGAEQLEKLARVVVAETLKEDLRKAADLERVPLQTERALFLERAAGRTKSPHTRIAYTSALDKLEAWCKAHGISELELTPATADDWIESLKAQGKSAAGVNLTVAAASSFFTWLERRHPTVHNPFRGTRSRPPKKSTRSLEIPTDGEIRLIENAAQGWLKAAIVLMSQAGLREGALPSLSISGDRFTCTTKGKSFSGKIPQEAREAIKKAGLSLRAPFADLRTSQIRDSFRYLTKTLHATCTISARFSCHDLRHAFAVRLYQNTRDIYLVEKALGHSSTAVTEHYLRSLSLEV